MNLPLQALRYPSLLLPDFDRVLEFAWRALERDIQTRHGLQTLATLVIFIASYVVIGIGRLPGFRIGRASAAVIGAVAMIAVGSLSLGQAFKAIDFNTIALLFAMMVVIAYLRLSGFFRLAGRGALKHAGRPVVLLIGVVCVSGFLSAFLVNDAVCLALTPLVLDVVTALRRHPLPYLLALVMASNVGSVSTITGNPQNMVIGSASGISYRAFAAALSPVAGFGLILTIVLIVCFFPKEFRSDERIYPKTAMPPSRPGSAGLQPGTFTTAGLKAGATSAAMPEAETLPRTRPVHVSRAVMWKSIAAVCGMMAIFFLGWPPAETALVAAAFLLFTRRVKPEKIFREIDWSVLALFTGLFIIVAGLQRTSVFDLLPALARHVHLGSVAVLSTVSAVLSNLVSNVPAVLLLKPFVPALVHPSRAWLTLAMSSTLAGNFTVLGSVAALIVLQGARRKIEISFWDFFKVGAPLTVLTILIGILWLAR